MDSKFKPFYKIVLLSSILGMVAFVFHFGFFQSETVYEVLDVLYFMVILLGTVSTVFRYYENPNLLKRRFAGAFDFLSEAYFLYILYAYLFQEDFFLLHLRLKYPLLVLLAIVLVFIREASEIRLIYKRTVLNPAQLFILSFLLIIFMGALILMLPKATQDGQGLSPIDAWFTSTSAVCVTGLVVVDTATHFTTFGKAVILLLIQIGGLGILTFASYFSYFFQGGSTYENQLTLSEMINSDKVGEVFKTLKYIIFITFFIEFISAVMIFCSLDAALFPSLAQRVFFSVFHSVSAFCNAGFSTLSDGLYDKDYRFNYGFQLIIIANIIFGGLGFPVVVNTLKALKYKLIYIFSFRRKRNFIRPWVLSLNSRITLITTLFLIVLGFVFFFISEYNNTLAEHSTLYGKAVTALFGSVTPRTAGFNSVNMQAILLPTVMITILLMWIGASPASTGGGIKTSTFAVAILNILSLSRGKERIEVYRREIDGVSIRRASATITLSLLVVGISIMLVSIFDPHLSFLSIAFECFSAYSTSGLSLGITPNLSIGGKIIIAGVMFIGRVSMLTILMALIKKERYTNYRYPKERISIN